MRVNGTLYNVCVNGVVHLLFRWPGEKAGWKFIKFHALDHLMAQIILWGWVENSSAQAGEHCHKFYLKILKGLTNGHPDWPKQIFKVHRREQGLRHILGAISKLCDS